MKRRDFLRTSGALAAWLAWPVPRPPAMLVELPPDVSIAAGALGMRIRERISMQVMIPAAFAKLRTSADGCGAPAPRIDPEERDRAAAFAVHPVGPFCSCPRCTLITRWRGAERTLPTYPGIRTERFREVPA